MNPNDFLFRESFYLSLREIEDSRVRLALYELLCRFGVTGENGIESYPAAPAEKAVLSLVLTPMFESIENTKRRYERAVSNGRKGGLKGGKLGGRGHKKQPESAGQTAREIEGGEYDE